MTKMTCTLSPLAALGVKAAVILIVLALNAAQAEDSDFIGCRKDSRSRLLGVRRKDDDAMTPALCKERCQGFKYYGVEFRDECFCGNTLDRPDFHGELPESKCDVDCAGDASFKCGGRWRISLYRLSVDGKFSEWSSWGACGATCGGSTRSRSRTCDSPAPSNGGQDCAGDATETEACNADVPCPADGQFGAWSSWNKCSSSCGVGQRSRVRYCNSPAPSIGGQDCAGDTTDLEACGEAQEGVACAQPLCDWEEKIGVYGSNFVGQFGYNTDGTRIQNSDECKVRCEAHPGCVAVDYSTNGLECWAYLEKSTEWVKDSDYTYTTKMHCTE